MKKNVARRTERQVLNLEEKKVQMQENPSDKKKEKKNSPFNPGGITGTVYTLLHDVICILAAVAFLFVFAARLVGVNGSSMYPTLVGASDYEENGGDYLVLKSNFLCSGYERGDIVVASIPSFENGKPIVKRVIARGGETVSFLRDSDGVLRVSVDGTVLDEPYIREPMQEVGAGQAGASITVPEGCYFLMGDNRNNSSDSRYSLIGTVDERYIVGRALSVLVPGEYHRKNGRRDWSRFGAIDDE